MAITETIKIYFIKYSSNNNCELVDVIIAIVAHFFNNHLQSTLLSWLWLLMIQIKNWTNFATTQPTVLDWESAVQFLSDLEWYSRQNSKSCFTSLIKLSFIHSHICLCFHKIRFFLLFLKDRQGKTCIPKWYVQPSNIRTNTCFGCMSSAKKEMVRIKAKFFKEQYHHFGYLLLFLGYIFPIG